MTRVNTAIGRKFGETYFDRDTNGNIIRVKLPTAEREYVPGGRPLTNEEIYNAHDGEYVDLQWHPSAFVPVEGWRR